MTRWAFGLIALAAACGSDAPRSGMSAPAARSRETPGSESDQGGEDVFDASRPMRRRADAGAIRSRMVDGGARSTGLQRTAAGAASLDAGLQRTAASRDGGARTSGSRIADAATQSSDGPGEASRRADASAPPDARMGGSDASDMASQRIDASAEDAAAQGADDPGTASQPADAGARPQRSDAAIAADASAANSGSCCIPSALPGCGDPALQACVCAQQPSCCSSAWDASCIRVIAERQCQPGVRDCVCGSGAGQWQQAQCCSGSWDDTCESVATNKCGATPDCS